ncbi:MAG: hypothetical protein M1326_08670 [Cyanobacteria bacterium]|nr:hypothetical protein [Cyanobacteriota bacterium]
MSSNNKLREGLEERIQVRIDKLKTGQAHNYFITHPFYPQQDKALNESVILQSLKKIEDNIPNIKNLIKSIRKFIPHIWDQTQISAAYLLIGKAFGNLETSLILAKIGHHLEIIELVRSGHESTDLAFLFLEDNERKYLKKWFRGEIIENAKAREGFQKTIDREGLDSSIKSYYNLSVEETKRDVYGLYSLYTHGSYAALLDAIDVFYEDYDFNRIAGFHHTAKNLHVIKSLANNILLVIKCIFIICQDLDSDLKADELLKAIGHSDILEEEIGKNLK